MTNQLVDQLDEAITRMLSGRAAASGDDVQVQELADVAAALRHLPRPEFRARLKGDLMSWAAVTQLKPSETDVLERDSSMAKHGVSGRKASAAGLFTPSFRSLTGSPMNRSHLATSFALHVAVLAGLLTSGIWVVKNPDVKTQVVTLLNDSPFVLPPSKSEAHGGGGGGDHDRLAASRGTAPRFAQGQLTPPMVVNRNEAPKLTAEPTVVGPPQILLPQSAHTGDPLANMLAPPSNGTGLRGGIGSGTGGGIGSGAGPGVGPGYGGGIGGGVYTVGGGVSAPRAIYEPDPEYSEEARKAKYQGTVLLDVVVGADGRPRNLHVLRSLGMGLDQKAVDAVSRWRFEPALKNGRPVAVRVSIEVDFRLY